MYADAKGSKSLQASAWPEFNSAIVDEQAEKRGDLITALIGEVRREKAEKHLPLNTQVKKLKIYAADKDTAEVVRAGGVDIVGALKVTAFEVTAPQDADSVGGKAVLKSGREVPQFPDVRFAAEYEEGIKK